MSEYNIIFLIICLIIFNLLMTFFSQGIYYIYYSVTITEEM